MPVLPTLTIKTYYDQYQWILSIIIQLTLNLESLANHKLMVLISAMISQVTLYDLTDLYFT